MDNDEIKKAIDFADKIKSASQFNVFRERLRKEGFGVQLNFSGYNDLMLTVRDIMKVCVAAVEAEEDMVRTPMSVSNSNIAAVLEVALQLMPMEEMQVLDECYALHLELNKNTEV